MPRSKRSNKGPQGARPESVSGVSIVNYGINTSNTLTISPASFSRAAAIADVFQFYRFTKLKVMIVPTGASVQIGYAPGAVFDTPPSTAAAVMELPVAAFHSANKTVDTIMPVSRKELIKDAQLPWFKTIPGSLADTQFEIQGNLYSVWAQSGGTLVISYTCEFQSWNLAGNSPLRSLPIPTLSGIPSSEIEDQKMVLVGGHKFRLVAA